MEKKRQKIWTAIGVGIAIALLLYWLTLAIWIDDDTDTPMPPPVDEISNYQNILKSLRVKTFCNTSVFYYRNRERNGSS